MLHTLKFAIAQHLVQHPAVSLLHLEATNVILEQHCHAIRVRYYSQA